MSNVEVDRNRSGEAGVPGATHLFEEPGTLQSVAHLAADWFRKTLGTRRIPSDASRDPHPGRQINKTRHEYHQFTLMIFYDFVQFVKFMGFYILKFSRADSAARDPFIGVEFAGSRT